MQMYDYFLEIPYFYILFLCKTKSHKIEKGLLFYIFLLVKCGLSRINNVSLHLDCGNGVSYRMSVKGNQVKVLNCSCSCKPHCKYRHESTDQRVGKEAMLVGKVRRPAIYHFFSPDSQEKGPA